MRNPLLLLFATYPEASSSIELLNAREVYPRRIYRWEQGTIRICGMGCLAAATTVGTIGAAHDEIWNFGAAGSLSDNLTLGQVVEVSQVSQNPILPETIDSHSEEFHSRLFPTIHIGTTGVSLISSDYPIHHLDFRKRLQPYGDLVDMEGYGIAFAAIKQLDRPVRLFKAVSDFTNPQGPATIKRELSQISDNLAYTLQREWERRSRREEVTPRLPSSSYPLT